MSWQDVDGHLGRAAKTYLQVRDEIEVRYPKSFVADFAGDLAREAERLALRAHLLSRRSPLQPEPKSEPKPKPPKRRDKTKKKPAEGSNGISTSAQRTAERKTVDLNKRIEAALDTVEVAHEKLHAVKPLHAVTKAFEEELDVLAEMTLSLHQNWERLDHRPKRTKPAPQPSDAQPSTAVLPASAPPAQPAQSTTGTDRPEGMP